MHSWTSERLRSIAADCDDANDNYQPQARDAILAFADRIEADERAVPVAHLSRFIDGNRMDSSTIGMDRAAYKLPYGDYPLFTYPPAQAAKPKIIATMMHKDSRIYGVDFRSEGGAEIQIHGANSDVTAVNGCYFSLEKSAPTAEQEAQAAQVEGLVTRNPAPHAAAPSVPSPTITLHVGAPTRPHSPDAADSVRVDGALWERGDDYTPEEAHRDMFTASIHVGKHDNAVECYADTAEVAASIRDRILAALAAQGQGDAVATVTVKDDNGMPYIERMDHSLPVGTHELFLRAASPAGVPDNCLPFTNEVIDKMQDVMADHGFTVPVRVISDAFNTTRVALRSAASATPEGGEVGL
jgi:hypothetical protein